MRLGTTYFLWLEGVLALSVMNVTLGYCPVEPGSFPDITRGFTVTCRDEEWHVQAGVCFLRDEINADPRMCKELHSTLRMIRLARCRGQSQFRLRATGLVARRRAVGDDFTTATQAD